MYDILIVGSGISALSFIEGLKVDKKKIAIISFEKKKYSKIELPEDHYKIDINKENLPPRFNLGESIQPLIEYFKKNKINIQKKIFFFGYLNSGGVSNYWGCSCEFPTEKNILFLKNKNKTNLINAFNHIYSKYNFTGMKNINTKNEHFKDRKIDNYFSKIINKTKNLKSNVNFYLNCIAVDSKKKKSFIPKNFNKKKVIKELNYIVEKIKKKNSYYEVFCEDKNGKKYVVLTRKLVLAAGTIASTKIVSEMIKYKKKIDIQHNPMLFGVFLSKKNLNIHKNFEPSSLAARVELSNTNLSAIANFRSTNSLIKKKLFNSFFLIKNFLSKKVFSLCEKRIIFINLYLDNKYSNLQMKVLRSGETKITLKRDNSPIIKSQLIRYFNEIFQKLKKENFIYSFKHSYLPDIGSDNHFTGTIPISKVKSRLSLNENSELKNYKNFYIIDGSAIPKTNLKFPTGLIIANAYRIGRML